MTDLRDRFIRHMQFFWGTGSLPHPKRILACSTESATVIQYLKQQDRVQWTTLHPYQVCHETMPVAW